LRTELAQLEKGHLVFRRSELPDAVYTFKHAPGSMRSFPKPQRSRCLPGPLTVPASIQDTFMAWAIPAFLSGPAKSVRPQPCRLLTPKRVRSVTHLRRWAPGVRIVVNGSFRPLLRGY